MTRKYAPSLLAVLLSLGLWAVVLCAWGVIRLAGWVGKGRRHDAD